MKKNTFTKDEILDILIESVMTFNSSLLKACLWSENLEFSGLNTMRFYRYYKGMVICKKASSIGELYLKIEKYDYSPDALFYIFHDNYHKYSRLSIEVKNKGEKVYINVMPF